MLLLDLSEFLRFHDCDPTKGNLTIDPFTFYSELNWFKVPNPDMEALLQYIWFPNLKPDRDLNIVFGSDLSHHREDLNTSSSNDIMKENFEVERDLLRILDYEVLLVPLVEVDLLEIQVTWLDMIFHQARVSLQRNLVLRASIDLADGYGSEELVRV